MIPGRWANPTTSAKLVCVLSRRMGVDPSWIKCWTDLLIVKCEDTLIFILLQINKHRYIYPTHNMMKRKQRIFTVITTVNRNWMSLGQQWQICLVLLCVCVLGIIKWHKLSLWCHNRNTMYSAITTNSREKYFGQTAQPQWQGCCMELQQKYRLQSKMKISTVMKPNYPLIPLDLGFKNGNELKGATWVLSAPYGPHLGPMEIAIRVALYISEFRWEHLVVGCCISIDCVNNAYRNVVNMDMNMSWQYNR